MKIKKEEIEFLDFAYNEIIMEKDTYMSIIKKCKESKQNEELSKEFKDLIIRISTGYNKFLNSIKEMLKNRSYTQRSDDLIFRMATYISLDVKNSTEKEIKKHLIHGSEVILNSFVEKLNYEKISSKTIINLFYRFIEYEENVISKLKMKKK